MPKFELVFRPDPKDVPEIMRRTQLILGQPFIKLPMDRRPDEHKILAVIDGHKVRRKDIEMVFNDTVLMNFTYRGFHQSEDCDLPGSVMAQIRALARELYGSYGQWVEANYGTVCLECNELIPTHAANCVAGARNARSANAAAPPPSANS